MDKNTTSASIDYEELIRIRNERNSFAKHLGMTATVISDHYAECEMEPGPESLNPVGTVHGGVLFALCDMAAASAAGSGGYNVTTVCSDFHFLRAGKDTKKLKAVAECDKKGRTLEIFRSAVYDDNGKELAFGTFTFMILDSKIL